MFYLKEIQFELLNVKENTGTSMHSDGKLGSNIQNEFILYVPRRILEKIPNEFMCSSQICFEGLQVGPLRGRGIEPEIPLFPFALPAWLRLSRMIAITCHGVSV